ncbi:sialate O-acetylesterase [Mucilaginibacter mallensis]|uniref:Sialate O-acetylesterase n=1 Tax=Mucilaginibacter mallensis TaxID=652787 RepID=A0A1H1PJR8_MUCMA|nr:sialate O-acetylesterase [Mucilaginibacter mallensis]SDS10949.1 sialate O-acetylesterase [Mucilaginibacter mallensis]
MKARPIIVIALLLTIFFSALTTAYAQVRLPQLINDGMVLQRDAKIKIWGWAQPGEKITINFNHRKYTTTTKPNGEWQVESSAMKSGGPYTMDISASNHITINDILIGDVWFCSGQSNMVLPMDRLTERYPDEIAAANYPQIRNFFISTISDVSKVHADLPPGKWLACNPENVLQFGAASYFFAKQLYNKYHVPIGIINSSVGGTPIQAWISEDGIKTIPDYNHRLATIKDTAFVNKVNQQALLAKRNKSKYIKVTDLGLTGPKTWYDTTYKPKGWNHFWLPGYWADQGVSGLNGVVWFRKEINVPTAMTGKPAKIYMGRIIDADNLYVNGVLCGNTTYQYPPRRYKLSETILKPGKNIITIQVINTAGKGGFVPDKAYYLAVGKDTIDLRGDWQYKVGQVYTPGSNGSSDYAFSAQNEPTGLYNTMVAPAINYAIKGIVWYQGETNANKSQEYNLLLTTLIADWRSKWQQPNLPFIYAQLPNFMEVKYSPTESQWAELRQQQLEAISISNTAMAVTIGAGEWNDIHPLNKKVVGERLALGAEKIAYHDLSVIASGPIYQLASIDGNRIVLTFSDIGGGLIAKDDTTLSQFAIAGADHKFYWAHAAIENNKVVVWSSDVTDPLYVRYAWQDNPEGANLYNKEGLPASPFTTEPNKIVIK